MVKLLYVRGENCLWHAVLGIPTGRSFSHQVTNAVVLFEQSFQECREE